VIEIDRVGVRLGGAVVLDEVSMNVDAGEWVSIIGPNGAGKTTLLRTIAQLESHTGRVLVDGRPLGSISHRERARLVAYLPQAPELPADMTVAEYVLLGRTSHISYLGVETSADRRVCDELIERLDLGPMASRHLATLSGGEAQRALLCRALAQQAPVLVLDEPTSALDLGRRVDALDLLDDIRKQYELTILSVLHDLTLAAEFASRLVLLSRGRIVASGAVSEVLTETVLSEHFGGAVRVLTTEDGGVLVAPRARKARDRRREQDSCDEAGEVALLGIRGQPRR
jgi:iron complex transport system ATP-binding protein